MLDHGLGLDAEKLSACVSCGLCLPHCPTFRVTGEERYSPRGRIDAMRAVQHGELSVDDAFVDFMETCVQCRGCETACPSGVEFGALMEQTRTTLADSGRITPWWQRVGLGVLPRHRVLLAGSTVLALGQRMRIVPKRLGLPRLALRREPSVETTGTDVWLFTGCVMDAWQRRTHRNTAALVGLAGATLSVPQRGGGCCGALHSHAGLHGAGETLARDVMSSMPGDAPILVNSAGCLDFSHKGAIGDAPTGWVPWFNLVPRSTDKKSPMKLLFGHWAALEGVTDRDDVIALDTGCVWGRYLTAYCLETAALTTVQSVS